jgi:hypothetical protein
MAVTLVAYRGRNDDGNETTATWKRAQNLDWVQAKDTNFRVRFLHQNDASGAVNNLDIQLQYQRNGGGYNNVTGSSNVVRSSASPNLADAANLTSQLTGGSGTFQGATGFDEVNGICGGNSMDVANSGQFETEFCVQVRSADVVDGDVIELRTINSDTGLAWGTYTVVARLNVTKAVRADSETVVLTEGVAKAATKAPIGETVSLTENLTPAHFKPGSRARRFAFMLFDDEPRLEEQPAGGHIPENFNQGGDDSLALSETLVKSVSRLATETLSATESAVRQAQKTISETVGLSENNPALAAQLNRAISETVSLSENLATQATIVKGSRARRFSFAFFDDEPRLEEQAGSGIFVQSVNDTVALTENLVRAVTHRMAESPAFTDALSGPPGKQLAENIAWTETLTKQVKRAITETVALTESLRGAYFLPDITETFTFTENLLKLVVKTLSISESISFTENLTKTVIPGGPISPAGSRARRFAFMLFDDEPRGEDQSGPQTSFKGLSDAVVLTEALTKVVATAKAETGILSEALTKRVLRAVAETMTLSEEDFQRVSKAVAETLSLNESFGTVQVKIQAMGDTVGLTESLQRAVSRAIAETPSLHEDLVPGNHRSLADQIAFSEILRSTVSRAIAETATLTENAAAIAIKLQSVGDALSATESLSKRVTRAIEETLTPTEALANFETRKAYADFFNFTEATQREIAKTVNETLGLNENLVAGILRLLNVGDVVSLTEQLLTGIVARGRFKIVEKNSAFEMVEMPSLYTVTEVLQ